MISSAVMPTMVSGNIDVGVCCGCNLYDDKMVLIEHIPQHTLYVCSKKECNHWVCETHREPCGFCMGCCAEEHGLGSH